MTTLKRTPLYEAYADHGAKTVDFGGWEMPVQFSGILAEHEAVRTRVGLFDVSHMGEIEVKGPDTLPFLQWMVTNDVSKLEPGMAMYSPMVNEQGGCVDDLIIYCFTTELCWVVVNAANTDSDFAWLSRHASAFQVTLTDLSAEVVLLALQGPNAEAVLQPLTPAALGELRTYRFVESDVDGHPVVLSRTGYTGEDGFEIYADRSYARDLWNALLTAGAPFAIAPCGLGSRDTLRLEARLPLYGHELSADITPLEAGLGTFVKLSKGDFLGRAALQRQKEEGVRRKLVGIAMTGRHIPRAGYRVWKDGQDVGFVTSGTLSPTLQQGVALALVETSCAVIGEPLEIEIRGKQVPGVVAKTPFYKRPKMN